MTALYALFKDFRIKLLLFFLIIAGVVWFLGPYLVFGELRPLLTVNQRLTALLVISILWGVGHWYASTLHHLGLAASQSTLFSHELKRWQYYFKSAVLASNHNWVHSIVGKPQKNWFLMVGPKGVGKSHLLKVTQNELHDEEYLTAKPITNTKSCDFWFFPNAVIMELYSDYLSEKNNLPLEMFTAEVVKSIRKAGIQFRGIILTVDALSIFREDKEPVPEINRLHLFLEQLLIHYSDLPIQIFVTKSDQISGFVEFFDDMGPEERIQTCGMSFAKKTNSQNLPELYNKEFDNFLTRINDRLIWRLHQEHDQENRNLIKDFPVQISMLKTQLAHLMNAVLPHTDIELHGIYFLSCEQNSAPVNNILPAIGQSFNLPVAKSPTEPTPSQKTFFVKMLMQRLLENNLKVNEAIYGRRPRYLAATAAVLLCTVTSAAYFYYHQSNIHIENAKQILSTVDFHRQTSDLKKLLKKLTALESATKELATNEKNIPTLSRTNKRLANKTAGTFIQVLQDELFNSIVDTTSKIIAYYSQTNDKSHLTDLYDALKVYLMLTQPQYLNKEAVFSWLDEQWKPVFTKDEIDQLERYTKLLFAQPLPYHETNTLLVKNARQLLTEMPEEKLILAMINNEKTASQITLINNEDLIILSKEHNHISAKYSTENFHTIYHKLIPEASEKIATGNWVLGQNSLLNKQEKSSQQLIAKARKQYLQDYRNAWESVIKNIKLPEIHRADNFMVAMNNIISKNSPLIQLFAQIKINTSKLVTEPLFNEYVSAHFEKINNQNLDNTSSSTFQALKRLTAYMNTILATQTPNKSAFVAAKTRMSSPSTNDAIDHMILTSRKTPEPIKSWFTHLATASWQLILEGARHHIQTAWSSLVVPEYHKHINNRYPIFTNSNREIPLKDFAIFFGPRGVMDMFFNAYVSPFIDSRNYDYKWKELNGQRLDLTNNTLDIFIRAVLIQKMFFAGADSRLGVNFSLLPVGLNPTVKDFSLDINGQKVDYQAQSTGSPILNWPGSTSDGVIMTFTTTAEKSTQLKFSGEWGWFKLLKKAHLKSTKNAQELEISFDYAGSKIAEFKLSSSNVINPFTPNILNTFRCPSELS